MTTHVLRTKRFEKDLDRVPEPMRVKAIIWNYREIKGHIEILLLEVSKHGY